MRDDKPFGGTGPPAAMSYYFRERSGAHPQLHLAGYRDILQADAFSRTIEPRSWNGESRRDCNIGMLLPLFEHKAVRARASIAGTLS